MQKRWILLPMFAAAMFTGLPRAAEAQEARRPQATINPTLTAPADVTRDELVRILEQYPPSVAEVLRLDPSLLSNHDYLKLYPALDAFLTAHPDVSHNPGYFFGSVVSGRGGRLFVQPAQPTVRESAMS